MLKPLGDRVVLKQQEAEEKVLSGIAGTGEISKSYKGTYNDY